MVQLVLHDLEQFGRLAFVRTVVGRQRENVAHARVHPPLARADVADAREQLVEVVGDARAGRVLQAHVVERETLDQKIGQARGCPLAELRAARTADAVADREDDGEAVVLDLPRDLALTLCSNHPEFPDGCGAVEFALLVDVHEVLVDGPDVLLEQLRQEGLRQPERLAFETALDARTPVLGLIEDEGGTRLGEFVRHGVASLTEPSLRVAS